MSRRNVHQEKSALLLPIQPLPQNNNDPKVQTLFIDDFNINNDNSGDNTVIPIIITSQAQERKKYHSICNSNDIPEIAKDVTWDDPFYQNDSNIIAAFDIDQNQVEHYLENTKKYYYIIFGISISVMFYNVIIAICICILSLGHVNIRRSKCSRYRTVHIAITKSGIYVDECDTAASSNYLNDHPKLMQRTIIKYETIYKCYIHTYSFWFHPYYEIIFLNTNNEMIYNILGFFQVQKFVDIVNVMIESSKVSTLVDSNDDEYDTNTSNNNTEIQQEYHVDNTIQIQQPLSFPHEPEIQAVTFDE